MPYSLATLNQMSQDEFTQALGAIFEETPAIARETWQHRPFQDVTALHQHMVSVVQAMGKAEQLALIRAHPDLGSKAKMAEASVKEQAGAGLDQLSPEEYEQLQRLNQAYWHKFDFPFIVAVKTHTKTSILAAFDRRLTHIPEVEIQQALAEIAQIAWFRLRELVADETHVL